jgi:hypothetical protein
VIGCKSRRRLLVPLLVTHRIIRRRRARSLSGHFCAMLCRVAERWHQAMKNRVLLEYYYLPGDLERQIGSFVHHYKHRRYHDSRKMREEIKKQTIRKRRLQHQVVAARTRTRASVKDYQCSPKNSDDREARPSAPPPRPLLLPQRSGPLPTATGRRAGRSR